MTVKSMTFKSINERLAYAAYEVSHQPVVGMNFKIYQQSIVTPIQFGKVELAFVYNAVRNETLFRIGVAQIMIGIGTIHRLPFSGLFRETCSGMTNGDTW